MVWATVADEHARIHADCQRASRKEGKVCLAHLLCCRAIQLVDSAAKQHVEHSPRFANWKIAELGELVIAEQEMKPLGEFGFEPDAVFEEQMRHAAAGFAGVLWSAVANLL